MGHKTEQIILKVDPEFLKGLNEKLQEYNRINLTKIKRSEFIRLILERTLSLNLEPPIEGNLLVMDNRGAGAPTPSGSLNAAWNCYVFNVAMLLLFTQGKVTLPKSIDMEVYNESVPDFVKDKAKLSLTLTYAEHTKTLHNNILFSLALCFQQAHISLKDKLSNSLYPLTEDIVALNTILESASNPAVGGISWHIKPENRKVWTINVPLLNFDGIRIIPISVDLTDRDGKLVNTLDFGGTKNVMLLINFVRSLL